MPNLSHRLIALAARLVPASARGEFRREWEAELAWEARHGGASGGRLLRRAAGAVPDALALVRQQWSADMIRQDVRYALRLLLHRPGFTLLVVLTLAAGIGANTAMFSVVDAVLLRPLPFKDPSRLVRVWENDRLNHKPRYNVAPANFRDWQERTHAFEHLAAFMTGSTEMTIESETIHLEEAAVTTNFLDALGVPPLLGRTFTPDEKTRPRNRVLILSHTAWLNWFEADPNVVGRTVRLGETPFRIVGVMPRGFAYPDREIDYWRPLPDPLGPDFDMRAVHFLSVIGRIRSGVTIEQAFADLETVNAELQKQYPRTNDQRGSTVVPLRESIVGDVRQPLYVLAAAVLLVLLIGCGNVANLLLVQAGSRRRELAVRTALGADRFRIIRQLVVEGLVLAIAGGAAGVLLAVWTTRLLARVAADYVPRITDVQVDARVLAFAVVISLGTGLLFALAPAWTTSGNDVQNGLRDGVRAGAGRAARRLRSTLAVAEFAAAIVLVIGAGLVVRSFWEVLRVSPGFSVDHVLTADTSLPSRYDGVVSLHQFYSSVIDRVRAVPGVTGAAAVNNLPMAGPGWTTWLTIEHRPPPAGEPPEVGYRVATPGYFETMRIPLEEGRGLSDADTTESQRIAVVNRALVRRFFPEQSPIGARIRIGPNPNAEWRTIVGIVGDVHADGPDTAAAPELYVPNAQDPAQLTVVVRTAGDPGALASTLRGIVRSIDPAVALYDVHTLDALLSEHLAPRRFTMGLLGGFAALALGLALLGIYGVMSYLVVQRTREIGVRMALGARRGDILRMVVGEGARLAAIGLALGVAASLVLTRTAESLLFNVTPTDPSTFVAVCAGVTAVALLACYLPARRAAGVNPLDAIRIE
ncbi:MAG TPA: ABC transporter permease [Vicinamibacterales bacterium]|nr:ABC transporter permease [Vicinamibacterales bacterium]